MPVEKIKYYKRYFVARKKLSTYNLKHIDFNHKNGCKSTILKINDVGKCAVDVAFFIPGLGGKNNNNTFVPNYADILNIDDSIVILSPNLDGFSRRSNLDECIPENNLVDIFHSLIFNDKRIISSELRNIYVYSYSMGSIILLNALANDPIISSYSNAYFTCVYPPQDCNVVINHHIDNGTGMYNWIKTCVMETYCDGLCFGDWLLMHKSFYKNFDIRDSVPTKTYSLNGRKFSTKNKIRLMINRNDTVGLDFTDVFDGMKNKNNFDIIYVDGVTHLVLPQIFWVGDKK